MMSFDPKRIAVEYYFGDLQYWELPRIAADALERGYDGPALRRLAGLENPVWAEMREEEIDCAFREMGVDAAPIPEESARMVLAIKSARRALNGESNVFDEATHIRIHLCQFMEPPDALRRIVDLSNEAQTASRFKWSRIERALKEAFEEFLKRYGHEIPTDSRA